MTATITRPQRPRSDLPADYAERVYAGALGKVIGVYLGRPFEGWSHVRIAEELGEVNHYVHEALGASLIVADDDISGTFTFIRALPDHGNRPDITPAQIGDTWLNYIIDKRAILYWGGIGRSTEHTAYLRMMEGIRAPESGSIARNGHTVAEQIGAQIFIDGWAMVVPGQPALAADLARRAATVSHDGEAVHAAVLLAAMESAAFDESDIDTLIDIGLSFVPADCLIATMIGDLRRWAEEEPDWRAARDLLDRDYGYHRYGGGCHVIPNHGLIILALLWGGGDWNRSMMIVNTAGWDTDCNSGNLGCLLGIRGGLDVFEGPLDWRGPVADRMYLPTADSGRVLTDVASESVRLTNIGRALAGQPEWQPKGGAQFHFELPGSVQGFTAATRADGPEGGATLTNELGVSQHGNRTLAVRATGTGPVVVTTPTFLPPQAFDTGDGYHLLASPTLYPSQQLSATVIADAANSASATARLVITHRDPTGQVTLVGSEPVRLEPGTAAPLSWTVPDTGGEPVATVGIEVVAGDGEVVHLDQLSWGEELDLVLDRSRRDIHLWASGWVDASDMYHRVGSQLSFDLVQNRGRGLLMTGSRQWRNYRVEADATPHLARSGGLAVRVQGLRRHYGLVICADGVARLISVVDEEETVLADAAIDWELGRTYRLAVQVDGDQLTGSVDGVDLLSATARGSWSLDDGGIALLSEEGRMIFGPVTVRSV